MKILITGCNGYIGSHLAKQIHQKGHQIFGLDYQQRNDATKYTSEIWQNNLQNPVSWNQDLVKTKWDVICHLAASVSVQESVSLPTEYYENNWRATVNILKNLSFKHFIFASTGAVENATSPYGISKAIAEQSVIELCNNYSIFRFFNVVGEGEFKITNQDGLLAKLKEAVTSGEFIIHGDDYKNTKDGTCVRDYIHVEDIAEAICNAIESKPANSPFECLGYGKSTTVREFVEAYKKVNNFNFTIKIGSRRAGDKEISEVPFVSKYMVQNYFLKDLVKKN